jgi:hypothetical protein
MGLRKATIKAQRVWEDMDVHSTASVGGYGWGHSLVTSVLECLVAHVIASALEQALVVGELGQDELNTLDVITLLEREETVRHELPDRGVELCSLFLLCCELRAKRVDGDVESATIGFELEDLAHGVGSATSDALAEAVERLEVSVSSTHTRTHTRDRGSRWSVWCVRACVYVCVRVRVCVCVCVYVCVCVCVCVHERGMHKCGVRSKHAKGITHSLNRVFRMISMFSSSRSGALRHLAMNGPSGVSLSTHEYSSAGDVATVTTPISSKRPRGWHLGSSSDISLLLRVPIRSRITLSIM